MFLDRMKLCGSWAKRLCSSCRPVPSGMPAASAQDWRPLRSLFPFCHSFCGPSGEQHRKPRAFALIASTDPQFTADPLDDRSNDPHSQSFAGGRIETLRQSRFAGESLAKPAFRAPVSCQLAFAARDRATLAVFKNDIEGTFPLRRLFDGHFVASLHVQFVPWTPGHKVNLGSRPAKAHRSKSIMSDTGH